MTLAQAPKHSICYKGPSMALSAEPWVWKKKVKSLLWMQDALLLPSSPLPVSKAFIGLPCVRSYIPTYSKETGHLAFKGDSAWTQPCTSAFSHLLAKSKMNNGIQSQGCTTMVFLFRETNLQTRLKRSLGPKTVPLAVNCLWTLRNLLDPSLRSVSKLLVSLLGVVCKETNHSFICADLALKRALPVPLAVQSSPRLGVCNLILASLS